MPSPTPAEMRPLEYLRDSAEIASSLAIDEELKVAMLAAPYNEFTPLGAIQCGALGADVFIGIKKRSIAIDPDRPVREIAIADTLLRNDPSLRTALPLFTVAVHDYDGVIGILTEDFGEAGKYEVREDRHHMPHSYSGFNEAEMPTDLHRSVMKALGGTEVYAEAMRHMSAIVNGRAVMIDFDDIAYDRGEIKEAVRRVHGSYHLAMLMVKGYETDHMTLPNDL